MSSGQSERRSVERFAVMVLRKSGVSKLLMFRYFMTLSVGGGWLEDGIVSVREIALWSDTPRSEMYRSDAGMFPVMMRSSV